MIILKQIFSVILAFFKKFALVFVFLGMLLAWPIVFIYRKIKESRENNYR